MATRRAYVGDFTLRFGPLSTRGKLMSIRNSEGDTKFHLMTPGGDPVHMVFQDPNGVVYAKEELGRGKYDEDKNFVPVDLSEIEAAKESSLTLNTFDLNVHNAADIDDFLFPDKSNAYVFEPVIRNKSNKVIDDPVNQRTHELINALVRNPKLAFIGRCNMNGTEGMYRLSIYRGWIVVQKQLYPEEVHEFNVLPTPRLSRDERTKVTTLAERMVQDFNPEDYPNEIAAAVAAVADGDVDLSKTTVAKTGPAVVDLNSVLDAALAEFG